MHVFEREVNGRRYRIAAQSVWDAKRASVGGTPGRAGSGGTAIGGGPRGDAHGGRTGGRRCRRVGVGRGAAGLGGADRPGLRAGRREEWSVDRGAGRGRRHPARVRARAEADLADFLDASVRAGVVLAGRGVQRAGVSSGGPAGHRSAARAGAGRHRAGSRGPLRAVDRRARVRHDELRHAYCHRRPRASWPGAGTPRASAATCAWWGLGVLVSETRACALAVPDLRGQRLRSGGAGRRASKDWRVA